MQHIFQNSLTECCDFCTSYDMNMFWQNFYDTVIYHELDFEYLG